MIHTVGLSYCFAITNISKLVNVFNFLITLYCIIKYGGGGGGGTGDFESQKKGVRRWGGREDRRPCGVK